MNRRGLETRRLVEVARLYYESHFTQAKIARLLKLSRPGVQRVLRQAREQGIVTITIADPLDVLEAVGRDLQEMFGLGRAIVVPAVRGDADATKARVGEAGARCLEALLKDGATLAVAWGTTVREVARALHPRRITGLRVVQMVGELGLATGASETFRAIADRLSGQAIALPAPAMEKNLAVRRSMLQSAHIREVFRILREAAIALTGVGPVASEATIVRRGQVTPEVMRDLAKQGAVGEINTKFFDRQGRPLRAINAQVIGMDLEDIKRIPKVVAVVSGGPGKASAVLGALRGKYIDILVIDDALASRVLATNREEEAAGVGAG